MYHFIVGFGVLIEHILQDNGQKIFTKSLLLQLPAAAINGHVELKSLQGLAVLVVVVCNEVVVVVVVVGAGIQILQVSGQEVWT